MKIPDGPSGFPTLSATQFRTYGAGGFRLDDQEPVKGCPRLYKARYIEHRTDTGQRADALRYGSFLHDVLFRMEQDGLTPDEALAAAFEPDMPQEFWTEARADLDRYLERGATPSDRFGTLQVEAHLEALLYVDEDFGPIWLRGFLDWLGIDLEVPDVLHGVDYKSNRSPARYEDLLGDVQLRGYHWLIAQNASKWTTRTPKVVMHLDLIKYRDMEVVYSDEQIEDWHSWAVAVARKILRDEEAAPVLNEGCAWCPVRYDCPAYEALPDAAGLLVALPTFADLDRKVQWRDSVNLMRLLLEKAVKKVDEEVAAQVRVDGEVLAAGDRFAMEPDFAWKVDVRALHRALGDAFYGVVSTSKTAIERATKDMGTADLGPIRACIDRVPVGMKMTRRKVEG